MAEIDYFRSSSPIVKLLFEFIKPRNRLHGFLLSLTIFYWIALGVFEQNKTLDHDLIVVGFIIGGLLISVLAWFGFIGFLETDNSSEATEEKNDEFKVYLDSSSTSNDDKLTYIVFIQLRNRLSKEIDNLSRRANLNLILGIITTVAGVVILASFVLLPSDNSMVITAEINSVIKIDKTSILPAVLNYLPKLTLVILIEVFALFFLKLYRYSLSEVKFFQNELTNCEMKIIALSVATKRNKAVDITKTINSFANVERNFILKKGERTIDLVRDELESGFISNAVDKATTVASKIKPAEFKF